MWRARHLFISCVIALHMLKWLCKYNVKTIKSKSETRFYLLYVQNEHDIGPTLYFFYESKRGDITVALPVFVRSRKSIYDNL